MHRFVAGDCIFVSKRHSKDSVVLKKSTVLLQELDDKTIFQDMEHKDKVIIGYTHIPMKGDKKRVKDFKVGRD